jgi:hypothetical protein
LPLSISSLLHEHCSQFDIILLHYRLAAAFRVVPTVVYISMLDPRWVLPNVLNSVFDMFASTLF